MKKHILFGSTLLFTTLSLTSCGSNPYSIEMYTLYESDTEVYFELNLTEYTRDDDTRTSETDYHLAKFDKGSKDFSIIEDREESDYKNITNYATRTSSAQYLRSNSYEGGKDNPIFYNLDTDSFIDIRTNEVIELSDECQDTSYREFTCNILDNDISVVLSENDVDNTFNLVLSNYVTNEDLTTYNFEWDTYSDPYTTITTYNKYDSNKVGIVITFFTEDPYSYKYTDSDHKDSIVFEYDINTETVTELFRGEEFRYFDFTTVDNNYLYDFRRLVSGSETVYYKYDIENKITSIVEIEREIHNSVSKLGHGYNYMWNTEDDNSIFRYDSNYNPIFYDTYQPKYANLEAFSGGYILEEHLENEGSFSEYPSYTLADINTGDIIFEISKYNDEFIEYLLTFR